MSPDALICPISHFLKDLSHSAMAMLSLQADDDEHGEDNNDGGKPKKWGGGEGEAGGGNDQSPER